MQLKRIIEENDTTAGKAFDLFIQCLIVLSLISFSIETLPDLGGTAIRVLDTADLVGLEGVAVIDLHPSGTVVVGNERLDVVCESGFVDKGARVRVVRSDGYRHVVLPVDNDAVA